MRRSIATPSFRDGPKDQTADAQLRVGESRDSGFDAFASPRNDASELLRRSRSSQRPEPSLPPHEIKIFPPGRRTIDEWLLLMLGRSPDIVADNVEQFSHLDMRLL